MTDSDTRMQERLHCKGGNSKKWKEREVKLNKTDLYPENYVLTVAKTSQFSKILGPKATRGTAVELYPSSHAILHIEEFDEKRNVLGLVRVDGSPMTKGMFFSCECSLVLKEVKRKMQQCCDVTSFQVVIGAHQDGFPEGPALLHIFRDRLCLTASGRVDDAPLGPWCITSQRQIEVVNSGIMLNIKESTEQDFWLLLITKEAGEIVRLFHKRVDYLWPESIQGCDNCDKNSNTPLVSPWIPRNDSFSRSRTANSGKDNFSLPQGGLPISAESTVPLVSAEPTFQITESVSVTERIDDKEQVVPVSPVQNTNPPPIPEQNILNTVEEAQRYRNQLNAENLVTFAANKDDTQMPVNIVRPTRYVYMNLPDNNLKEFPIKSGTSIRRCYENLKQTDQDPPPIPERQRPPKPPPRGVYRLQTPEQTPPGRPPKPQVQVQVAVFESSPVAGQVWFLRVAVMCKDPNDDTLKRVKGHEEDSKHHLVKVQPLTVASGIKIALHGLGPEFECLSEDSQHVDFEDVKNLLLGDWFVIEFHLKNTGTEPEFYGKVYVGPGGPTDSEQCSGNRKLNIGVSKHFEAVQAKPTSPSRHLGVLSNFEKRTLICRALDITLRSENNWKRVAGCLEFTVREILEIEDKAHRVASFSPMETVLCLWEQREPGNSSWNTLKNILKGIDRLDIIEDVESSECS